jgi:hypothetical protein
LEIKRLNAEIIQGIFLYELNGEKTSTAMQLIESFKELSDGRYQIKGRQKFKESFKILEKRYQQYLEKFENNNIFLKDRRNGEKILRSSKKIGFDAWSNFNFFKIMTSEIKNNWSFWGKNFWSPKELIKGNGFTNILLSTGGTLYDYIWAKKKVTSSLLILQHLYHLM